MGQKGRPTENSVGRLMSGARPLFRGGLPLPRAGVVYRIADSGEAGVSDLSDALFS